MIIVVNNFSNVKNSIFFKWWNLDIIPFLHFQTIIHGLQESVKILFKINSAKEGCQNLEIQGHLLSSSHKNSDSLSSYELSRIYKFINQLLAGLTLNWLKASQMIYELQNTLKITLDFRKYKDINLNYKT